MRLPPRQSTAEADLMVPFQLVSLSKLYLGMFLLFQCFMTRHATLQGYQIIGLFAHVVCACDLCEFQSLLLSKLISVSMMLSLLIIVHAWC